MVAVVITTLASIFSNGVTEGCGVISGLKGVLSPVTSGLSRVTVIVVLVVGF